MKDPLEYWAGVVIEATTYYDNCVSAGLLEGKERSGY